MPKIVEIDEDELGRLRKLHQTVGAIVAHPEGKKLIQRAHKAADPTVVIPELEAETAINGSVSEVKQQLADMRKQLADDKAEHENKTKLDAINGQISTGLAKLRREGWTEEGIKGVEKIMNDKGIIDPDVAAAYFEKQHPPQTPATPAGGPAWNFVDVPTEGADDIKKLIESRGENEAVLRKMTQEALTDFRGPSRR